MPAQSKLDELRLKTDQQLAAMVEEKLDLGGEYADLALTSDGNLSEAWRYGQAARKVYGEASTWMGLLRSGAREELAARLKRLGNTLDALAPIGLADSPTRDQVASLARELWRARGCPEGVPEQDWYQAERLLQSPAPPTRSERPLPDGGPSLLQPFRA